MKDYKIEVSIFDVKVNGKYYSFDYSVFVNDELFDQGNIDGDYENGNSPKQQKKMLLDGEAMKLALIRVFE